MDEVLDVLDLVETVDDVNDIVNIAYREPRRSRPRLDPFTLPDREFKGRYRFSKDGVRRLTDLLRPGLIHKDEKGCPFTPEQIVCCGLNILGSAHFQQTEGVCIGSAKSTAQHLMYWLVLSVILMITLS